MNDLSLLAALRFREKAARSRRPARDALTDSVALELQTMAREYERRADSADSGEGCSPPSVAQALLFDSD